jgi:hypothetical protein
MKPNPLILLITIVLLQTITNAQITDAPFIKKTKVGFKFGTTINSVNKALYENLNDGLSTELYKPTNISYFINPYASVGIEHHFLKHAALHFNLGFYQTLQKYSGSHNYQSTGALTVSGSNIGYGKDATSEYINNNVFLELLPTYIYKHTRFFAGFNITRTSPTIITKVTITNYNTGEKTTENIKDRPEESYHLYSIFGVMHGFPIKSNELTVSASYFGLLKKYDSGINIALGFLF